MSRKKIGFLVVVVAMGCCLITLFVGSYINKRSFRIDIDKNEITHIVVFYRGLGPKTLYYSEHKDALDSLLDLLSGSYDYSGLWRVPEVTSTGVTVFNLYSDKEEITIIRVLGSRVLAESVRKTSFYAYTRSGEPLDLSDFYLYLGISD